VSDEARKTKTGSGRGPGRPKSPVETDKVNYRAPVGFIPLADQIGAVMRRWNGAGFSDGMVIAEALALLAERLAEHPAATEAERAVIRERLAVLRDNLDLWYRTFKPEGAIRP